MNQIRPLGETADSVTLSRTDFETLQEELEDAADRIAVLEDCVLDQDPNGSRHVLTIDETMRIIDGEHPVKVWREKRGLTVSQLAHRLGQTDAEINAIEQGQDTASGNLSDIARHLDVPADLLSPPTIAP
jgi:ribosome-binding protein aMBF1 (putative translation factor)